MNTRIAQQDKLFNKISLHVVKNMKGFCSDRRGSILIFTLWVFVLLSLFSLAVGQQVRQRLKYVQTLEIRQSLRTIAEGGIKKAVDLVRNPGRIAPGFSYKLLAKNSQELWNVPVGDGFFSIYYPDKENRRVPGIWDEGSKVNINTVGSMLVLKRLFTAGAGLDEGRAGNLASAIFDWRDEDDVLNAGGAESRYYRSLRPPYEAKNDRFDSLEELLMVKGMSPDIYVKAVPYLTLYGNEQVNVNTVSGNVLKAYGMAESLIRKIRLFRAGPDRKTGTPDDGIFRNQASIAEDLNSRVPLSQSEMESLQDYVGSGFLEVRPRYYKAYSEARLKHRQEMLTMSCVFDASGTLLRCSENYTRNEGSA